MTPTSAASSTRLPGWLLYGVWGLLFAFSLFYQVRHTNALFFAPRQPSSGINTEDGGNLVSRVPEGVDLKRGDAIEGVNGLPFRGSSQIQRARFLAKPGDRLYLDITRAGVAQRVSIPWRASPERQRGSLALAVDVFSSLLMPWFAMLFGFWLLYRRPHDPMAWVFLWVMLCATRMFQGVGSGWEDYLRQATLFLNGFLANSHGAAFLLVGIHIGYTWRHRFTFWLATALAGTSTALALLRGVSEVIGLEDFRLMQRMQPWLAPEAWNDALIFVCYGVFFFLLFAKYFAAEPGDLKRRFRFLLIAMNVSMVPGLLFILASRFLLGGNRMNMPQWAVFPVFVLISLAPMSLAYVILVHRAVDVGVVIRSGLRYTLARGGVFLLQLLVAVIGIIWAVQYMETQHHLGSSVHAAILGAYAGLLFAVRWLSGPLFRWIDRLFFRDAYSSEQVMADLTEQVRTVLDPQELFQTVSERLKSALHVEDVTFFLRNGNGFVPAYATGSHAVDRFADDSLAVRRLSADHEPMQIFIDDSACWCNRPEVPAADRERLMSLNTQVLLPLSSADRLVGFASLGPKRSEEPYTRNDLRLLKAVGTQAGLALENSRLATSLATEAAQKERVHRELEIATEVQQRLFPQKSLVAEGVELAGYCRPALAVGGDYFDYFRLENGSVGLAVGDVAGKGLGAALVMATLQASLRTQVLDGDPDLAALMSRLNRVVYEASTRNRFATLFYAQYDRRTRCLTYVNAGHNAPMVLRASGEMERLKLTGIAVGLTRHRTYQQATVELQAGDLLVAFTDGISEAMNAGREEWGEERLAAYVASLAGTPAQAVIESVMTGAETFTAGATQHDDMTMVVLRVNE